MRPGPVEKGQRPHDELAVVLPERAGSDRVDRVENAVRDQVPGMLILREVDRQRVPVAEDHAPGQEAGHLEAEHEVAKAADAQQHARWLVQRPGWRGPGLAMAAGGTDRGHEPNLTARIGEYPYG